MSISLVIPIGSMPNGMAGSMDLKDNGSADAGRDACIQANGDRVLRFWNNDVMKTIDGVPTVIADAIDGKAAAFHP